MTKAYSGHARDDEARLLRDTIETLREENAGLAARVKQLAEAVQGFIESETQGVYEHWIAEEAPSGDATQVQAQWECSPEYEEIEAMVAPLRKVFARPIPATPNRFCPRCGKDLKDMVAHTCTPPRDERQAAEAGGLK